jgi:hypothetical protein
LTTDLVTGNGITIGQSRVDFAASFFLLSEIEVLTGKAGGPVPVELDVADIKVMWTHCQELKARHPGGVAVEVGIWRRLCSPGANIRALSYRCGMLGLLEMMVRPAWTGGESENACKVAARMDLNWMLVAVVQNRLPFNLDGFLAEPRRGAA